MEREFVSLMFHLAISPKLNIMYNHWSSFNIPNGTRIVPEIHTGVSTTDLSTGVSYNRVPFNYGETYQMGGGSSTFDSYSSYYTNPFDSQPSTSTRSSSNFVMPSEPTEPFVSPTHEPIPSFSVEDFQPDEPPERLEQFLADPTIAGANENVSPRVEAGEPLLPPGESSADVDPASEVVESEIPEAPSLLSEAAPVMFASSILSSGIKMASTDVENQRITNAQDNFNTNLSTGNYGAFTGMNMYKDYVNNAWSNQLYNNNIFSNVTSGFLGPVGAIASGIYAAATTNTSPASGFTVAANSGLDVDPTTAVSSMASIPS